MGIRQISPGFLNRYTARFGQINGVDVHAIESRIADTILAACEAAEAVCFDLMREVTFDLARDFYDEVHTNAQGAEVIAAYLQRKLTALDGF